MGWEKEPLGVAVLYNVSACLVKGEPRDLLAEEGVAVCAEAVSQALRAGGYRVVQVPVHLDVELAMAPYPPTEWIVFNLGEGLEGRLFEEPRIVWALEAMGYCLTGSAGDAIARSVHKARAKDLFARDGVPTPSWWFFRHPDDVDTLKDELAFPLIVKPVAEDASIGVGAGAVVHSLSGLRDRIAYVVERYRQAALAETFITGREFNVALWGDPPQVLPLAEIDFSAFDDPFARIVSFAAKWEEASFEYHHTPVLCPAPLEQRVADRIAGTARRAWDAVGCRGYGRVDMRLGAGDVPYVVEVNCNPDLSPEAGFHRAARVAGYSYEEMVSNIVDIARRQYNPYNYPGLGGRCASHPESDGHGRHLHTRGVRLPRRDMERVSG